MDASLVRLVRSGFFIQKHSLGRSLVEETAIHSKAAFACISCCSCLSCQMLELGQSWDSDK